VREIWIPELTHPAPSETETDVRRRARVKLNRILAEHEVAPLDDAVKAGLDSILNAAAKELGA